jgi:predicted site-specific integrase-resolvase
MANRWTEKSLAESVATITHAFSDKGRKDFVREHADAVQRLMVKARTMLNIWRMEYTEELVPEMNAAIEALELELQACEKWQPKSIA